MKLTFTNSKNLNFSKNFSIAYSRLKLLDRLPTGPYNNSKAKSHSNTTKMIVLPSEYKSLFWYTSPVNISGGAKPGVPAFGTFVIAFLIPSGFSRFFFVSPSTFVNIQSILSLDHCNFSSLLKWVYKKCEMLVNQSRGGLANQSATLQNQFETLP